MFDAFRLIDRDAKGYVTVYDLKDAFADPRILDLPQITMEDIELIITRYDKDNDMRIRFSEFADAFSPIDSQYHEKILSRKVSDY